MTLLGRSSVRREALEAFLAEPALEVHPRALARRLGRAAPPVVRELSRLEEQQVLSSRRLGTLRLYRLAATPQAEAVRQLMPPPGVPPHREVNDHDRRLLLLHARIADKLRHDPDRVVTRARANIERWRVLDPAGNEPWIDAWTAILDRGPAATALAMLDPGSRMRELRQSSPFAGVLTMSERLAVIRETAVEPARR